MRKIKFLIRLINLPLWIAIQIIWKVFEIFINAYFWLLYGGQAVIFKRLMPEENVATLLNYLKKKYDEENSDTI
jgi:hypothetical protein